MRRSGTAAPAVGDAHIEEGQLALQHVADDDVKLHCQLQPCHLTRNEGSMHTAACLILSPVKSCFLITDSHAVPSQHVCLLIRMYYNRRDNEESLVGLMV